MHREAGLHGVGDTTLDVRHGLTPVLEPRMRGGVAFDTIVAADMLYDADVAQAVGAELGDVVARSMAAGQSIRLVVCDPGRRCREDFLDAFRAASNLETARFDDVDVVEVGERDGEAGSCETESPPPRDIFDGSPQVAVGVLTWSRGRWEYATRAYAVACCTRPRYCNYNI